MQLIHLVIWLVVGLVAGLLARLIVPGRDSMSIWMTAVLGIAGSFVGGFVGNLIWRPSGQGLVHPGGLVLSVVGAVLLLLLWRMIRGRTT
jgi:uncharacterized membrane protein YeaQ/YmgE (transglycosylase-associated protein family)